MLRRAGGSFERRKSGRGPCARRKSSISTPYFCTCRWILGVSIRPVRPRRSGLKRGQRGGRAYLLDSLTYCESTPGPWLWLSAGLSSRSAVKLFLLAGLANRTYHVSVTSIHVRAVPNVHQSHRTPRSLHLHIGAHAGAQQSPTPRITRFETDEMPEHGCKGAPCKAGVLASITVDPDSDVRTAIALDDATSIQTTTN